MFDKFEITLASNSPRRKELLAGLGVNFKVETGKDEKEVFSDHLPHSKVPEFLAKHKSDSFHRPLRSNEILITADTLVFCPSSDSIPITTDNCDSIIDSCDIMGKPSDRDDAFRILRQLSGKTHYVLTGVTLRTATDTISFTDTSEVTFRTLEEEEITYYIDTCNPYDKAGAYGIQEWIGYAGITSIKGSYFNIMGLPVEKLYRKLKAIDSDRIRI